MLARCVKQPTEPEPGDLRVLVQPGMLGREHHVRVHVWLQQGRQRALNSPPNPNQRAPGSGNPPRETTDAKLLPDKCKTCTKREHGHILPLGMPCEWTTGSARWRFKVGWVGGYGATILGEWDMCHFLPPCTKQTIYRAVYVYITYGYNFGCKDFWIGKLKTGSAMDSDYACSSV